MARSKRVFVVEDDYASETVFRLVIKSMDPKAEVHCEDSAEGALVTLHRAHSAGLPYDLIIADISLTGPASGIDLWRQCRRLFPLTPVLITSGTRPALEPAPPCLLKPFEVEECRRAIASLW